MKQLVTEPEKHQTTRPQPDISRLKVAYMMSRFPKITETFILYEILELKKLGIDVEIYPLIRERVPIQHPEVADNGR